MIDVQAAGLAGRAGAVRPHEIDQISPGRAGANPACPSLDERHRLGAVGHDPEHQRGVTIGEERHSQQGGRERREKPLEHADHRARHEYTSPAP